MLCSECGRLHRELPDFIVPYKHYICEVVQSAIEKNTFDLAVDDSVIQNWRRWFDKNQVHFWGVLGSAAATTGTPIPQLLDRSGSLLRSIREYLESGTDWLQKLVRIIVNSGNWICTEFAWMSGSAGY